MNTMHAVAAQARSHFVYVIIAWLGQPARIFERLHSGQSGGGMHRAYISKSPFSARRISLYMQA